MGIKRSKNVHRRKAEAGVQLWCMRVSQLYKLGRTQAELDFVDVDVEKDTRVFISPRALAFLPTEWADECGHLIRDFFTEVLRLIRAGEHGKAQALLGRLREPNETHLGMSKEESKGHAIGEDFAAEIWEALSKSQAVETGLLEDLEDTVLMIRGISIDLISDITTNIIREPLIRYTQEMCKWHGIPMEPDIQSGPLWDHHAKRWTSKTVELPVAAGDRLLLVPKAIVRRKLVYDVDEYYRHYVLEYLQDVELNANTALVRLLKNGRRRVTKKSLSEKYGTGKEAVVRETLNHPEILARYRRDKRRDPHPPLTHEDFAEVEGRRAPDWGRLLQKVLDVPPGLAGAGDYEKAVEGLLTALLYPMLAYPERQSEIHDGRKRIDIRYTNMARGGFFHWVGLHFPAAHIFFECKNYGREIGNPELDQISGRFSPTRGQVGIIVCRSFEDKELFMRRCRDTARDERGYVLPLDDDDLRALVELKKTDPLFDALPLLQGRFTRLTT